MIHVYIIQYMISLKKKCIPMIIALVGIITHLLIFDIFESQ